MNLALQRHAGYALLAAALFGASTPSAKRLLGDLSPLMLAGLLYLGSGIGLTALRWIQSISAKESESGNLHGKDYLWLASSILAGGVCAPVLLLWGLSGVSASVASLLLNFEAALTTILASLIFGEAVGKRVWWSVAIMLLAGSTLVYSPDAEIREFLPAAAVIAACLLWGLDNNLTRYISGANATTIAIYKGIAAGCVNLTLAALAGATLPSVGNTIAATLIGFFSYGLSLVLFIIALRHLGSARTSAHFGTAPFFGAALSIILLNEPLTMGFAVGLMLMIFATSLVLTETHEHFHVHTPVTHEHPHRHDEHHDHAHSGQEGSEPHSHIHTHAPLAHSHPHLPDLHHRHRH